MCPTDAPLTDVYVHSRPVDVVVGGNYGERDVQEGQRNPREVCRGWCSVSCQCVCVMLLNDRGWCSVSCQCVCDVIK